MKHYQLTITSKNKKSVENCFLFFQNNASEFNLNTIQKYFKKKKKRNILTILKSPHVNKSAQEQFESKLFSKQLSIYSSKNFQFLLFLKKIKTYLFHDVKMKIKFILNKNLSEKIKIHILNPTNFKLNVLGKIELKKRISYKKKKIKNKHYSLNKNSSLKNIQYLLKMFDMYSEFQKN
jgi:ribosomal protein S10